MLMGNYTYGTGRPPSCTTSSKRTTMFALGYSGTHTRLPKWRHVAGTVSSSTGIEAAHPCMGISLANRLGSHSAWPLWPFTWWQVVYSMHCVVSTVAYNRSDPTYWPQYTWCLGYQQYMCSLDGHMTCALYMVIWYRGFQEFHNAAYAIQENEKHWLVWEKMTIVIQLNFISVEEQCSF